MFSAWYPRSTCHVHVSAIFPVCSLTTACQSMSVHQVTKKVPRKDCTYTDAKIAVILPFKETFIQQTDRESRAMIAKQDIVPRMLEYWLQEGIVNNDDVSVARKSKVSTLMFHILHFVLMLVLDRNYVRGCPTTGGRAPVLLVWRTSSQSAKRTCCGRQNRNSLTPKSQIFSRLTEQQPAPTAGLSTAQKLLQMCWPK